MVCSIRRREGRWVWFINPSYPLVAFALEGPLTILACIPRSLPRYSGGGRGRGPIGAVSKNPHPCPPPEQGSHPRYFADGSPYRGRGKEESPHRRASVPNIQGGPRVQP